MKKLVLLSAVVLMSGGAAFAQKAKKVASTANPAPVAQASATPADAGPALNIEQVMKFKNDVHDFGHLREGDAADYVFEFKNSGKEPLVIQRVQASCGCTTPDWSKDPITPGKSGIVKASYATQGRPGAFTKTLTVYTNQGNKVLTIKGDVEKAPESSVPQNSSMIRTN